MCPPPISGLEQLHVLYGVQFKFEVSEKVDEIEVLISQIKKNYANGERKISKDKKRILITGCPMGGVTDKVVRVIEESNGVVVAYENCSGVKNLANLVDENTGDPYQALAERYLDIGCSVMSPNPNRFDLLEELIDEYKIDGVIEMTLQACHTYNIETHQVKKMLKSKGIPFLSVETDYSTSDIEQLKTRCSAFIEMIS